ncbi:MAG: spike base protein, RCAP_Rcc01079 family [Pseudomonas sp.]
MQDTFSTTSPGLDSPASQGFAITPHDTTEFSQATRAIYVGTAGTLAVTLLSGAEISLAGVAAGTILPLRAKRVLATGTTADALVGLL